MTTEPNIEPLPARVAQRTTKRETLGMAHEDWRRLGRCVAWCYTPMVILKSMLIFGISFGDSIILSLLLPIVTLTAFARPIVVAIPYFGRLLDDAGHRLPKFRLRLGRVLPPATRAERIYLSRTFIALAILYIPMLWMSIELGCAGEYLVGKRAEPVIDAVEKYVAKHGTPPESVQDLIPDYISSIPIFVPQISIERSVTVNGYNPGYWYLSMDLPSLDPLSSRSLTYCSAGQEGIFADRVVPCSRWMRCTSD